MSFLSLADLTALQQAAAIGAATAAVGLLVAMYFLKLKRIRQTVSSTFLWKKSVHDMHANSPFQKLRRNLLLLLQLLILLAALFALGRPAFLAAKRTGTSYILLIDNSASMAATDVEGSRLAAAADRAKTFVDGMGDYDAMMVISFAARPNVVQTMTTDMKALLSAIDRIEATDESTEIAAPVELAGSLAATVATPKIILISDGAFPPEAATESVTVPLEFFKVGERSRNLGVTAMDIRPNLENPSIGQLFARITNFSGETLATTVTLEVDGKTIDAQNVKVAPARSHAAVFKVALGSEKVARISTSGGDDLAADDSAWAILEPPRDITVVLAGGASPFLRRSVSAGGTFTVVDAPLDSLPVFSDDQTPVYVCEAKAPASIEKAGYLIFAAAAPGEGFADLGVMDRPVVLDVDDTHPVTAYLQLDDLFIAEGRKMSFPPETKVLVKSDQGPLAALSYSGGARVITVAFDPMNSRWPLRISYPMFIANAINYLASNLDTRSSRMLRTGDVLVLDAPPGGGRLTVTDPAGTKKVLPAEAEGTVAYGDTHKCGVYTVSVADSEESYVANLTDSAESDITPGELIQVGSEAVTASKETSQATREIWRELLLLAFVVLLVEWYIYNRRVYI